MSGWTPAARAALRTQAQEHLARSIEAEDWSAAGPALRCLLDSWPLAAMAPAAEQRWAQHQDPRALVILLHARRLCWRTGGTLGADLSALDQQQGAVAVVSPADLGPRRHGLAAALVAGEVQAVWWGHETAALSGAAALAAAEFLLEGERQASVQAFGPAALAVAQVPPLADLLLPAPAGVAGTVLRPLCDSAMLPGTPTRLAQGDTETVGWLVWGGPHAPVPVHPVAVHVLRALDGQADLLSIAQRLGGPADQVQMIAAELLRLGAATAA